MTLIERHEAIKSREDLVFFIDALRNDLKANPSAWENADLGSFLEAMKSWTEDMEGYYKNHDRELPNPPTWQVFGDMLMGARIYE